MALSVLGVVLISISGWLGGEMVFKHGVAVETGFRREARRGQVIEMKDATHFIFRGTTADQVVRQTREFLLK